MAPHIVPIPDGDYTVKYQSVSDPIPPLSLRTVGNDVEMTSTEGSSAEFVFRVFSSGGNTYIVPLAFTSKTYGSLGITGFEKNIYRQEGILPSPVIFGVENGKYGIFDPVENVYYVPKNITLKVVPMNLCGWNAKPEDAYGWVFKRVDYDFHSTTVSSGDYFVYNAGFFMRIMDDKLTFTSIQPQTPEQLKTYIWNYDETTKKLSNQGIAINYNSETPVAITGQPISVSSSTYTPVNFVATDTEQLYFFEVDSESSSFLNIIYTEPGIEPRTADKWKAIAFSPMSAYYFAPAYAFSNAPIKCCFVPGITSDESGVQGESYEAMLCCLKGNTVVAGEVSSSCQNTLRDIYKNNMLTHDAQTYCTTFNCDSMLDVYCADPTTPKAKADIEGGNSICSCFDTRAFDNYRSQIERIIPAAAAIPKWNDPECFYPKCYSLSGYHHEKTRNTPGYCPDSVVCFNVVNIDNDGTIEGDITINGDNKCSSFKPEDCVVNWSPWSDCDKPCGKGSQTRTGTIAQEEKNGGKPCPKELVEKRECNEQTCKVGDCAFEWSKWGDCSKSCNGGTQTRYPVINQESSGDGLPCPPPESRPCNTQKCETKAWVKILIGLVIFGIVIVFLVRKKRN